MFTIAEMAAILADYYRKLKIVLTWSGCNRVWALNHDIEDYKKSKHISNEQFIAMHRYKTSKVKNLIPAEVSKTAEEQTSSAQSNFIMS